MAYRCGGCIGEGGRREGVLFLLPCSHCLPSGPSTRAVLQLPVPLLSWHRLLVTTPLALLRPLPEVSALFLSTAHVVVFLSHVSFSTTFLSAYLSLSFVDMLLSVFLACFFLSFSLYVCLSFFLPFFLVLFVSLTFFLPFFSLISFFPLKIGCWVSLGFLSLTSFITLIHVRLLS